MPIIKIDFTVANSKACLRYPWPLLNNSKIHWEVEHFRKAFHLISTCANQLMFLICPRTHSFQSPLFVTALSHCVSDFYFCIYWCSNYFLQMRTEKDADIIARRRLKPWYVKHATQSERCILAWRVQRWQCSHCIDMPAQVYTCLKHLLVDPHTFCNHVWTSTHSLAASTWHGRQLFFFTFIFALTFQCWSQVPGTSMRFECSIWEVISWSLC